MKSKILNILEENIGENILSGRIIFLKTQKAQVIKKQVDIFDYMKIIKNLYIKGFYKNRKNKTGRRYF